MKNVLQSRLNLPCQRAEIGDSLQLVVRKFDSKMILQLGQQIECLQAVNSQCFEEVIVRTQSFPRHLKMRRSESQYFIQRLFSSWHSQRGVIPNGFQP